MSHMIYVIFSYLPHFLKQTAILYMHQLTTTQLLSAFAQYVYVKRTELHEQSLALSLHFNLSTLCVCVCVSGSCSLLSTFPAGLVARRRQSTRRLASGRRKLVAGSVFICIPPRPSDSQCCTHRDLVLITVIFCKPSMMSYCVYIVQSMYLMNSTKY